MTFSADGFGLIQDIDVRLTVELGRTQMRLRDVLGLAEESVVTLDRLTDEPLDVMVNGKLIARGEVVAEGNRFGLRILELVGANGQGSAPRAAPTPPPAPAAASGMAAFGQAEMPSAE
ncbi:flagellar motor switch protein FliN/FliY [Altererythrobacter atlanticus]|uniref:Flagellar motor switch protein FliN n=1 Tax=Croceibacterium atlanticum TaxID=1267766 RepID=A0A0F7KUX2_9SPHN|nr:flagellar motor switch protein FliN [Croceibacterium atlanticum]AKH44158.1 Flagellar motor switch protein FliN [Croceibacterium atlanticum]MBB5732469.1 flagellar motor switch protein FliN/FliY [Croceibacterium atlanticum]